ncbi:MAG: hypothetical protein PUB21_08385 [Bacteroidales bacterium]|nr:hypothetical protein [Bacteroidales bacterium]
MKSYAIVTLTVLAMIVFVATGCGNGNQKENTPFSGNEEVISALDVDALLANADSLSGKDVTVEGICTHICKHGGRKIFLMGSDDTRTIRVEAGKKIGKFSQDAVNSIVEVHGKLMEQRIDEAYLLQWEEKTKANTDTKHGNGTAGCATEKKARGEENANSVEERIANFRKRVADRKAKDGKEYLSFYYIDADDYTINQ